jgi:hypothetical protein
MDAQEAELHTPEQGRAKHDTSHNRLKAVDLPRLKPGYHHDGGGLYLDVRSGRSAITRVWVFRYTRYGKARTMGLGPSHTIGLADARAKARECRKLLLEGLDPIEVRKAQRAAQRVPTLPKMTFRHAAEAYMTAHEVDWKNPKHRAQWTATLRDYAFPILGDLPVADVETEHVMRVLSPIWNSRPETASRLQGRIAAVLDWASAQKIRAGENAARWKGLLDKLLPKKANAAKAKREAEGKDGHHEALAYKDIAGFMERLRAQRVRRCELWSF